MSRELTPTILDLIEQVYAANPELVTQLLDDQRKLSRKIAEQIVYFTGDRNWGVKSSSPTNPQGPSQIAYKRQDGTLVMWRWLDGVSLRVLDDPLFMDITGQNFIPVDPIDHLGKTDTQPAVEQPKAPVQNDISLDIKKILEKLGDIEMMLGVMKQEIDENRADLAEMRGKIDRRYIAKIFGATVVISPER